MREHISNILSRSLFVFFWSIDEHKQRELVEKFNNFLDERRKKYNSLFLTNYRESKDIARKRISFDLVYLIVGYLLEN
jgi:hypothetical protein